MAPALLLVSACAGPSLRPDGPDGIAARPGRPGFVVAARHGAADDIAGEVARRTGFGLVLAPASGPSPALYAQRVQEAARGPLRLYAEIHGNGRRGCDGRLTIIVVGADRERALRLRALAELVRDAHLGHHPAVERLEVQVEPLEEPGPAAAEGMAHPAREALHIGLPRCARAEFRETYAAILADFLAQAVLVPPGR